MPKIDLHTHSDHSPDGGTTEAQYLKILHAGTLDFIAITDHNQIDFAVEMQKKHGDSFIVGEEIMTTEGEVVGLYLTKNVPDGLTAQQTVDKIKEQNGLVYIPHPFETVRKGLPMSVLEATADKIDIIEIFNGRAISHKHSKKAVLWSKMHSKPGAASSDAHGIQGIGKTYTNIPKPPTKKTLPDLIAKGTPIAVRPDTLSLLYPKYHRIRKKLTGANRG